MTTDNRLTDEDRGRIRDRISETVAQWKRETPAWRPESAGHDERAALVRLGAHAIGCSLYDLRDCEEAEIYTTATEVLDGPRPVAVTVTCEDGAVRHEPFPSLQAAEIWAEWGHVCTRRHTFDPVSVQAVSA